MVDHSKLFVMLKKGVFLLRSCDSYHLKRWKSGGVLIYLGGLLCLIVFGKVVFSLHICLLYTWTGFWLNCVGCYWGSLFVGALAYADDIVLLAPCASALRHMLSTCSSYASGHGLIFNVNKTQLICFRNSKSCNFLPTIRFLNLQLMKSNILVMSWTIIWMTSLILLEWLKILI